MHIAILIQSPANGLQPQSTDGNTMRRPPLRQHWVLSLPPENATYSSPAVEPGASVSRVEKLLSPEVPQNQTEPVLASTGTMRVSASDYKSVEEVDLPAIPQANWIIPIRKGYLDTTRSLEFRVWIDAEGTISGVDLLAIKPDTLASSEMQEIVEWLSNTPMQPAQRAGLPVANVRTIEIVLENSDR